MASTKKRFVYADKDLELAVTKENGVRIIHRHPSKDYLKDHNFHYETRCGQIRRVKGAN